MRRWVIGAVVVVLVAAGLTVALTRGGGQEQAEALAAWQADLQTWQEEQATALVVPEGPALSEVATGAAMSPIGGDGTAESVDEVNTACTRLTAFTDQVRDTPGPPAPPADVEPAAEYSAAFEADLSALTAFQQALTEPAATLRQFCGTYPLLINAHQAQGGDRAEAFVQALQVQCPLPELAEACAALIDDPQHSDGGADPAVNPDAMASTITAELAGAEEEVDAAAAAFDSQLASP